MRVCVQSPYSSWPVPWTSCFLLFILCVWLVWDWTGWLCKQLQPNSTLLFWGYGNRTFIQIFGHIPWAFTEGLQRVSRVGVHIVIIMHDNGKSLMETNWIKSKSHTMEQIYFSDSLWNPVDNAATLASLDFSFFKKTVQPLWGHFKCLTSLWTSFD